MMEAIETVRILLLASLFGGFVFFPSVVAPVVFKVLEGDDASRFLRTLFPRYYLFIIMTSGVAALLSIGLPGQALTLAAISLSTLFVRQVSVPKINAWRDAEMDGDQEAGKKFERGHKATVILNISQLVMTAFVLFAVSG